jgi:translocation and assembly module TamB
LNALPQPPFSDFQPPREVQTQSLSQHRALWKRILLWVGAGICVLVLIVVVAAYGLLHSSKFHAYLLRTTQAKATQTLGSEVRFRDFAFHWSGLGPSIELYDIVIQGAAPYADPPLVQADRLRVQVTISSLWHRNWYVNDIEIERPIVRMFVDQQGQTNLPHTSNKKSSNSNVDIFQLGVRHLSLQQGEVYYNDQKSDLAADVHDLAFQVGLGVLEKKYSGTLSYRDGHIKWQGNNPIEHDFDARFSLTPAQFVLEYAKLTSGHSQLTIQATARDYSQPKLNAAYSASIDTGEFRRILRNNSLPGGIVLLSGVLDYQNSPNRPFLISTALHGEAHSAGLTISQGARSLRVGDVAANYSLIAGDARVSGIRGQVLGGALAGELNVRDIAGAADATLTASIKHVSARALQDFSQPASRSHALLNGTMTASINASWRKALAKLMANAQVEIAAGMQPANGQNNILVTGELRTRYDGTHRTLAVLGQSYICTPQTSVSFDGTLGNRSSLQVRLQSGELHEFEEIASAFRSADAAPLGLHGQGSVIATINGSTQKPQVRGQLSAFNMRLRNTSWKSLRLQFAASPSSVTLDQGELLPASRGKITFGLNTGLQQWSFALSSSFRVQLQASNLDAHEIAQVAGTSTQVSGNLNANVEAHGTQQAPVGQGTVQLSKATIANEPIKSVKAGFQADGKTITAQARVDLTAGSTVVDVHYEPDRKTYEATVRSAGIKLEEIENIKNRNMPVAGTLTIDASGRGTLDDPGLQATIQIPQLVIRNQAINNIKLTAGIMNRVAKFSLDSEAMGTRAGAQGTIQLNGDYPTDISLNTQPVALQPVLAMYAPSQAANLSGQTEIHATLRGPLKRKEQIEAHVEIPQLSLNYKDSIKLAATAPIRADYVRGTLDVKRSVIRGTGTDLTFQANVPSAKDAPVSILLQGSVDLQLAQLLSPDITSAGQLRFDIDSTGRRSDPTVQGQVRIVNASLTQAGIPLGLRNGNGLLTLTRDRLNITEFKGQVGGGNVTASGGVLYRPNLRFDLAMKAEGVRALYEQSIRATVDSDLALSGQYDNALLRGQVNVEQLSFTSTFDLMSFASAFGGGEATPPPTGGFSENLRLDVAVETPGGLNLSSRDLSLAGSADLHVRGTASEPVLLGRINVSDGDLIFYGNRYLVQGGTVDFRNPSRTEPVMDMSATTTIQQYDIQMHFWGPADHLHTNYSSDPSLPPSDIINLIAFGKTSEAAAANPTPPGSLGAQSLIASQVSGQVTSRIEKLAGISQLSVDPVLGSSQQSPGARVAIQQRVTGKIFVTFATDVTATQQQVIQVEYQVNRRMSLKAVRDQNGGFSLQTSFRKEW